MEFKAPAWKTRAVRHSAVRTQRQLSQRPIRDQTVIPFLDSEHYSKRRNGVPKNRGQRLHLEDLLL